MMELDERASVTVQDGSGRTWVFKGAAGPAEQWLRHQALPTASTIGPTSSSMVVSTIATGRSVAEIKDVTEIIRAMDEVRRARQVRADEPISPDIEGTRRLLAS